MRHRSSTQKVKEKVKNEIKERKNKNDAGAGKFRSMCKMERNLFIFFTRNIQ